MVIGAFPVAKLGMLAIRQIAKPIAEVIKRNAKKSKLFRDFICMPPAQMYNWIEVKTKMWALNLGKPVTVPPLNEAMAIELGANLLGEFTIFTIGAGALIFEYTRQTNNESKKQEVMRQEKMDLLNTITELGFRLEQQDTQIREMTRALADLESRSIFKWHRGEPIGEYRTFDRSTPDQTPDANRKQVQRSSVISKALDYLDQQIFQVKATKSIDYIEDVELQPYVITLSEQPPLELTEGNN